MGVAADVSVPTATVAPPEAAAAGLAAGVSSNPMATDTGSQVTAEASVLCPGSGNGSQAVPGMKSHTKVWLVVAGVVALAVGGGVGAFAALHKSGSTVTGSTVSGQSLPYKQSGSSCSTHRPC